jgi:hypothetical protein
LLENETEEEMNTLNLKRLTRIHWLLLGLLLLGAAWLCKPQTQVAAQGAEQSFFAPETWAQEFTVQQGWGYDHPRLLADVNADNRQDVVGFGNDGVWIGTSTGTIFSPAFALGEFGYNQGWRVQNHVRTTGDINGDRREDVVGFGDAGVYRALSTGTGLAAATYVVANFGYNQGWRVDRHVRLLADVNNDGRKDIVGFGDHGVWLSLATSTGHFTAMALAVAEFGNNQGWTVTNHIRTTADVNGDGRQDIVGFGDHGVWIALSTGNGFGAPQLVLANFGYIAGSWKLERHYRVLADINKDGKQDIVGFGDEGVWIARSTGSGFEAAQLVIANFGYNQSWRVSRHPRFVADLNGDGYQDIFGFGNDSVYRALGGPGGFGSVQGVLRELVPERGFPWSIWDLGFLLQTYPRLVGDVNDDGMQDLVAFDRYDVKVARSSNLPPHPPAAPSNLRITGKTTSSLTLAWNDNSSDERQFYIHYFDADGQAQRVSVGANATTHTIGSLVPNTQYCFTVQAESAFGLSAESARVCGSTNALPPTPSPTISAIFRRYESGFYDLNISGSGFQPPEQVSLKIITTTEDGNSSTVIRQTTANSSGRIYFRYPVGLCQPARSIQVQATGLTSARKSNVIVANCAP